MALANSRAAVDAGVDSVLTAGRVDTWSTVTYGAMALLNLGHVSSFPSHLQYAMKWALARRRMASQCRQRLEDDAVQREGGVLHVDER